MKSAIVFLSCALLAACAFHSTPVYQLPQVYRHIRLLAPLAHQGFAKRLCTRLLVSGVQCSDLATPVVLEISDIKIKQSPSSTYEGLQTQVYTITYSLSFRLIGKGKKDLLKMQHLTRKHTVVLKATQALHSDDELTVVQYGMESELIEAILYRLMEANKHAVNHKQMLPAKSRNKPMSITDRTASNASKAYPTCSAACR